MKYELHIPVEQYGFVAATVETEDPDEVVEHYQALKKAFQSGEGVPTKDFNALLDEYLSEGSSSGLATVWEEMTNQQQSHFREIKKSRTRRTNPNK